MKKDFKIAFLPKDVFNEKMPDSSFIQFPGHEIVATIISDDVDVDEIEDAITFNIEADSEELSEYVLTTNSVPSPYTFMKQFGKKIFSSVGIFGVKVKTMESLAYIKAINQNSLMSQFEMRKKDIVKLFCVQKQEILHDLMENSVSYTHLYNNIYLVKDEDAADILEAMNEDGTAGITISPFVTKPQKYIMKLKVENQGLSDEIRGASAQLIDTKYLIFDDFECDAAKSINDMICETNSFSLDMNFEDILKIAEFETGKVIWFSSQDDVLSITFKTTAARVMCVNKMPKLFMPNASITSATPKNPPAKPAPKTKNTLGINLTPKEGIDYWLVYGLESNSDAKRLSQVLDECCGCQTSRELERFADDGGKFAVLEFPSLYNAIKSFHKASFTTKFSTIKIKGGHIRAAISKLLQTRSKLSQSSSDD